MPLELYNSMRVGVKSITTCWQLDIHQEYQRFVFLSPGATGRRLKVSIVFLVLPEPLSESG